MTLTFGTTATAQDLPLSHNVMFGAYTYGGVWTGIEPVLELERELGYRLDIVHWYTNWDTVYQPQLTELVTRDGRLPLISWQPHRQSSKDIAGGVYDEYIREWARGAASSSSAVYVRPFPEMNGYWTGWNGDATNLIRAWRHIVDLFEEEGAVNVRWVFSPNVTDEPAIAGNRLEDYYPGGDYVDALALDGFNWGTAREYIGWRSFTEIFESSYDRITALGEQPVWIAEFGSTSDGGDKAAWVAEAFATRGFDRVEALVWFDEDKSESADWRIREHPEVVQAFRRVLTDGALASGAPLR